jgi:hypothetical protein
MLMAFAIFMASAVGRLLRIIVGLALIIWGAFMISAASNITLGIILVVVGLLPFIAGLVNVCVFAPLFGAPFSGDKLHAHSR